MKILFFINFWLQIYCQSNCKPFQLSCYSWGFSILITENCLDVNLEDIYINGQNAVECKPQTIDGVLLFKFTNEECAVETE